MSRESSEEKPQKLTIFIIIKNDITRYIFTSFICLRRMLGEIALSEKARPAILANKKRRFSDGMFAFRWNLYGPVVVEIFATNL